MNFRLKTRVLVAICLAMPMCKVSAQTNGVGSPVQPAFHAIPIQGYSTLDISGTVSPIGTAMELDNNNDAAFESPDVSSSNQTDTYSWQDGTLTKEAETQTAYTILGAYGFTELVTRTGLISESTGNTYGTESGVAAFSGTVTGIYTDIFINTNNQITYAPQLPSPPYSPPSQLSGGESWLINASDNGAVIGNADVIVSGTARTIQYIEQSGTFTVFDSQPYASGQVPSNVTEVPDGYFLPFAVNDMGWAIGYDGTNENIASVWTGSGSAPIPLAPILNDLAINNIGQVVGSDENNIFYLWTSPTTGSVCPLVRSGTAQPISQLVPEAYQSEVSNIKVLAISGTGAGGIETILFNATFQTDASGDSDYQTFLLTLTSGSTSSILQEVSPDVTNDSTFNINIPMDSFVAGVNAQGVMATSAELYDNSGSHDLLLLPVQLTRHDATISGSDVILDDWPATGSNPRSPKWLFAHGDSITVHVPQIQGLQINVASQTDPTGITFDPTQNTVQLSTTTGQQSGYVTIATKTKEVLTFSVVLNSSTSTGPTVMVARAKFASCAIQDFSSDASCCENDATSANWFMAGNTVYPDDVGTDGRMATFMEEAGDNSDGQASMLLAVCHGAPSGQLLDSNTNSRTEYVGNAVTLYTETGTYVYTPGSYFLAGGIYYPHAQQFTWNGDVEWVWLDACSTLNTTGGGEAVWTAMMSGTSRPVHAILGACLPVAGDLSEEINSFWSSADQYSEYLLNAYEIGMQVGGSQAQPWAFIANNNDLSDQIKKVEPDGPAGTTYSYLDAEVTVAGKAGGVGDSPIRGIFDSGNGILRTDLPTGNGLQLQKAKRMQPSPDLTKEKRLGFARRTLHLSDGRQDFVGNGLVETLHQRTSLTEDRAATLATKYLADNFPEFASRSQLKKVSQRVAGTRSNGRNTTSWSNGYLVEFSITSGGIPIWNNYAEVTIRGDEIQNVSFRYYDEGGQVAAGQNNASLAPMAAGDCLGKALPDIKSSLGINGKYEVLKAELMYVNRAAAQGKEADLREDVIPAWHLIVNSSYQGEGSKRTKVFHVWLDASTGKFIGKKPY